MKFKWMTKLNWKEKKTFLNTIFIGKTARLMGWLADWHLWLNLFNICQIEFNGPQELST